MQKEEGWCQRSPFKEDKATKVVEPSKINFTPPTIILTCSLNGKELALLWKTTVSARGTLDYPHEDLGTGWHEASVFREEFGMRWNPQEDGEDQQWGGERERGSFCNLPPSIYFPFPPPKELRVAGEIVLLPGRHFGNLRGWDTK